MSADDLAARERDKAETLARESIALLRERTMLLPDTLMEVLGRPWDEPAATLTDDVVVTGIGGSGGPARLFAWLLVDRLKLSARFVPLSAFAGQSAPKGRTLVLFSQGLSPNARLALRHIERFERVLVLTSTRPSNTGPAALLAEVIARRGSVIVLPPATEDGLLLRVLGPAAACLAACAIVETASGTGDLRAIGRELREALRTARHRVEQATHHIPSAKLDGPCAFVSAGVDPAALYVTRWKWLEGLRTAEPFGWDLLAVAHGPVQSIWQPTPFLVLASAEASDLTLIERLESVLAAGYHPRAVLWSALPFPFSVADHDAQLNELLLRVLEERPRDLRAAAAVVNDEPLYGLGR